MNPLHPLETQLRCWTPRAPTPRVERRLFAPRGPRVWPRLATALAPLMAGGLIVLTGWRRFEAAVPGDQPRQAMLVAACLSNQSFAPYLAGNPQSVANRWDSFEWTNRGDSRSSIRFFTPVKTSDLQ